MCLPCARAAYPNAEQWPCPHSLLTHSPTYSPHRGRRGHPVQVPQQDAGLQLLPQLQLGEEPDQVSVQRQGAAAPVELRLPWLPAACTLRPADARRRHTRLTYPAPRAPLAAACREQIATFQQELGKMGYKFQFVTLAGERSCCL